MRKVIVALLSLTLCMAFTACSNAGDSSSANDEGSSAVQTEKMAQRCIVYKDSNTMHDGVQVQDTDFKNWIKDYKDRVISSGTLVDEQGDDAPKGAYIKIELDGVVIYATAPDWKWIGIGGDIYEVDESLVSELYDYVDGYFDNSSN
mgnify:CR=1 FL=1